ncbi:acyltransferase family protein [Streptomyces sp. JJ36]|uniref:acyltransferase family protein n=1 Tax=Streptomyces sp. JJ36 TaxID=2736645 RepID=UPI001F0003E7|nr:acyltransferase family protein [Streptomyces sp. JJ36]
MLHARYERAPLPPARPDTPTSQSPPTSAEPPAPRGGGSGAKQRDPFFDNAKYLTILLVGLGHAWEPLRSESRTAEALYYVVYTFHMPAFILISGYLSRSFTGRPGQIKRLITGIAVPYLIFEITYTFFMRWADNPDRDFSLHRPGFALWFLVALFIWRLTTPLWQRMRWPLPVALAIGLAAGVTENISGDLNLMRVLQFLPFFVLGLQLRPVHFEQVRSRALRIAAVPVGAAALLFAYWAVPRMDKNWFLHTRPASEMGVPSWVGGTMYLALFGCALVLTACFFAWVPRRQRWFTALGAGTLYAYLLHVYPIKASREFGWYEMAWVDHPLSRVAVTLLAAVMMTALCTAPVQRLFRFAMEPRMDWFFRPDPEDRARTGAPAGAGPRPAPAGREGAPDGHGGPEGVHAVRERDTAGRGSCG